MNEKEKKYWNIFKNEPRKEEIGSAAESKFFKLAEKSLLIFVYIVTFLAVLAGCVVGRGITFFMLAQISVRNRHNFPFCNGDVNTGFYIDDAQEKELEVDLNCADLAGADKIECLTSRGVERSVWIWCLFFAYSFPNLGAFVRSLRIWLFKKQEFPRMQTFLMVLTMESLHALGMAMLLFLVLPELDSLRAMALTAGIGVVPCIFNMISRRDRSIEENEEGKYGFSWVYFVLDCAALVGQLSALLVWPIIQGSDDGKVPAHPYPWAIPLSLLLVTCPYWETYVGRDIGLRVFWSMKREFLESSRYFVYVIVAPIKMILFFGFMVLFVYTNGSVTSNEDSIDFVEIFFNNFAKSFGNHTFTVKEVTTDSITSAVFSDAVTEIAYYDPSVETPLTPVYVLLIQIGCSYAAYVFAKFASKVQIGLFSFATAVTLAMPVSLLTLILGCGSLAKDECVFQDFMPHSMAFECPDLGDFGSYSWNQQVWMVIIWFLSFLWITGHIWFPRSTRLASSEQIFSLPWYEGLLIDQMLMLNRRKDGDLQRKMIDKEAMEEERNKLSMEHDSYDTIYENDIDDVRVEDKVTRIKACATMWHETKEEMTEMLKSLFRVDLDYVTRSVAQKKFGVIDPDYYEWETHILFDDSMDKKNPERQLEVNQFVKLLVETMHEEASKFYKPINNDTNVNLSPCRKKPTPYGGRIEWRLPGGTEIIVHLKVNEKIRHKKRWSQCMYMYYLLGYQIMDNRALSEARKNERAKNTYLLALDGDIDFQPHSIIKLVDMMKKNNKVGAACGRIHPTGSGYMPWYQKFEYAIGHWLQKATEHVLGCVLCSPGCFSLFRGEALMDNNVMRKYTTVSSEARHYVQFDQGEDRWLCTLLLQQGWRVEYSAASDAYTACPVTFEEFYNQRRRWMPSTIMNIVDLLRDYKHVIEMNPDISIFYIIYQGFLMVSTFVGPGAIFLIIAGAFNALFHLSIWYCILILGVPVLLFMASCYYLDASVQLKFAKLLTVAFVLIMAAVFITIFVQIINEGSLYSPTAISFFSVFGAFIIAGILHPYEISCLLYMLVYYFTIPSMYLLLVIYSLFNMWNVSWGTREVPKDDFEEQQKKIEEVKQAVKPEDQGMLNNLLSQLNLGGKKGQKGGMEMSLGNLCSCMFFTHDDPEEKTINKISETLAEVNNKISDLSTKQRIQSSQRKDALSNSSLDLSVKEPLRQEKMKVVTKPKQDLRKEEANPYWLDRFFPEMPTLGGGDVEHLPSSEKKFWDDLIKEYLTPLVMDDKEKAEQKKGLEEFRDQLVFTFVMVNFMYVIAITLMQNQKNTLSINWPFDVKYNVSYNDMAENPELEMMSNPLVLEPIGLFFLIAFIGVMILQIIGMFMHRWTSFSHTMATTKLGKDAVEANEVFNYIKLLFKYKEESDDFGPKIKEKDKRRGTVANLLADTERSEKSGGNLNIMEEFEKRHSIAMSRPEEFERRLSQTGIRRDTLANIKRRQSVAERRASLVDQRRQSLINRRSSMATGRRDSGIMFEGNNSLAILQNNRKNSAVRFSIDSKQGVENNGYEDSDYGVSLASSYSNNQQDNRFETIESNF